ncbi:MAG: SipW-dependent-type signal peptide-containing protein [Eubacteriales bacterium]|nr:SipW-dependent-type signal peptide-containing protein [Eubacteriales bacterium]
MKAGRSIRGLVLVLALALIVGVAGGATFAWLTAKSDTVVNTFTYGDISIELKETTGDSYKIIPGVDIEKDPLVTVKAGSEACWLFVKVDEENWPELTYVNKDGKTVCKVNYDIADGWTKGDGTGIPANVYYRVVNADDANQEFPVLKDNKITVSNTLTKIDINEKLTGTPKLSITAYAIQKDGMDDAAAAWAAIPGTTTDTTQP